MSKKKVSKLSKKKQKELYAKQRNLWNVNPVTKVVPSGKAYVRSKKKRADKLYLREKDFL